MSRSSFLRSVPLFAFFFCCTFPASAATRPAQLTIAQHFNADVVGVGCDGAVDNANAGVDIIVTTAGGTATAPNAYSYFTPMITSVTPATSPISGGTALVITGIGLDLVNEVRVGGVSAAISDTTATAITVTAPAHAAGPVDVAVVAGTSTATAANAFFYTAPVSCFDLAAVSVATGASPFVIATGYFDSDERLDLALGGGNVLKVLTGNGDGTFSSKQTFTIYGVNDIAVAELNGDGRADLVVAASDWVYVAIGTGDGTFATPSRVGTSIALPESVVVADFNLDGWQDIVLAARSGSRLYLGNGSGGVLRVLSVAVGFDQAINTPDKLAVGDFNRDGKPDLVATAPDDTTWSGKALILLGDGNGAFTKRVLVAGGTPMAVAVGDLNGDAVQDLVFVNYESPTFAVLIGDGTGGFQQPAVDYPQQTGAVRVAISDFNSDGAADVVTAHPRGLAVYLGNRDGTLSRQPLLYSLPASAQSVVAGDFNGDGQQDIIAGLADATLSVNLNPCKNQAPFVSATIADQSATEDVAFSFTFGGDVFTDPDVGDMLTFTATTPSWLSFSPETRTFSGTPLNEQVGAATVTVSATESGGLTATTTFHLTVTNVNDPPVVQTSIGTRSATEDEPFTFTIPTNTFADVDAADTMTISAWSFPFWLSWDAATSTLRGTPLNDNVGSNPVTIVARDRAGASATETFTIAVANVNDAPTLVGSGIANQTTDEDSPFTLPISAAFADVDQGDTLSYTAILAGGSALPAWLQLAGGTFTGQPGNSDVGVLEVQVTATDASNASASDTFLLTVRNVNDAPTVQTAIGRRAATEDSLFTFVVPADTFVDIDAGDTLTLSAPSLPSWLSFDPATRTFSGTPLNDHVGAAQVTLFAHDRDGASASDTFAIDVANTNDAPVVAAAIPDRPAMERVAFTFTFADTTFTDVDRTDSLSYSATLPDGTPLPAWLTFAAGSRSFTGTPGSTSVGLLTVKVTATDSAGASASTNFTIQVNPAPVIVLSAPPPYCDNSNLTLSSSQVGTAYSWQRDGVEVAKTRTLNASVAGTYTLLLRTTFGWPVVTDAVTLFAAPSATVVQTTNASKQLILTAKPDGMAYSWSHGSALQSITVTASRTLRVTVSTPQGCQSTVSATVRITEPGRPRIKDQDTGISVSVQTLTIGSVTVTSRGTITAPQPTGYSELLDPTGKPITYDISMTGTKTGPVTLDFPTQRKQDTLAGVSAVRVMHQETINNVPKLVDVTTGHTYDKVDPQNSTVQARVNSLSPFILSFVKAPTLAPISGPAEPVLPRTTITASVEFTDPDTLFGHTATWSWGDGTTSIGSIVEPLGDTFGSVTGSHAYASPGTYTISVEVSDNTPEGGTATGTFPYVAVINLDAGSVTGGGAIDSPAGAFTDDRTLAGKATFAFTAKFDKNGAPKGEAEFNLHGASFRLKSTAYEWLVVTGASATCGGRATANGEGDYGFILTAIDGDRKTPAEADRFRLRVWDRTDGWIYYDNVAAAGEDVAPAQIISGGSIVIHK